MLEKLYMPIDGYLTIEEEQEVEFIEELCDIEWKPSEIVGYINETLVKASDSATNDDLKSQLKDCQTLLNFIIWHEDNRIEKEPYSFCYGVFTESLQRILDYITPSKFHHYCEASVEERAEHIYNDIELVQNYIGPKEKGGTCYD